MYRDDGQSDLSRVLNVPAGRDTILWFHAPIELNCAPSAGVTYRMTAPSEHGTVRFVNAAGPVFYKPTNPRSACNGRRVAGVDAIYHSAPGFRGIDDVEYAVFWPGVRVLHFRFQLHVQ